MNNAEPKIIVEAVERALLGKTQAVQLGVATFLAGGHLLIEDVPGVGKTTFARALARTFNGAFSRIQFTSDMLPSDILGIAMLDTDTKTFAFKEGPVFANLVLADEINRASPRTQSAMMEAMGEGQVTVEKTSEKLPSPFMVIATQNGQEHYGTYPLPESQLDRFTMRIALGYTRPDIEKQIISKQRTLQKLDDLPPVVNPEQICQMQERLDTIKVTPDVLDYMMAIISFTRESDKLTTGCGPRGGIALHRTSRAWALLHGREFVTPDDVKAVAEPVIAHRLITRNRTSLPMEAARLRSNVVQEALAQVEVPV